MRKLFLWVILILGPFALKLNSQAPTTYSILSTAYNRASGSFFSLGNVDNYWFLTRMEDMVVPNNPGSVVLYPNNPVYVVPNTGNNTYAGILPDHSINTNATTTSLGLKLITYRTYFNLPNLLTTNNRYSLAFKMSADDAVFDVKLNGTKKAQFLTNTYNNIPGVNKPYLLNIPVCDTDFVSGQNFIDVTIADAGGSVGFYAEVVLSELANVLSPQLSATSACLSGNGSAASTLTTNIPNAVMSYSWTNSSGTLVSQTNNTSSLTNSVSSLPNGTYTVLTKISGSCNATVSRTININCAPTSTLPPCRGVMTGTGMSICNQYSFTITPSQTITPLNYGNQGYACTGVSMPDVSFNTLGSSWRVEKHSWFFAASLPGRVSGYTSASVLQTIPFVATDVITPISYSGTYVEIAVNGVSTGILLNQSTFSISITSNSIILSY